MIEPVVFLGGTCGKSTWREKLIPLLDQEKIAYFNPVVDDWNEEAQAREEKVKAAANTINLFVITKEIEGYFSIAEAVQCSNDAPKRTIFAVFAEDMEGGFTAGQIKSWTAVSNLVWKNGAQSKVCPTQDTLFSWVVQAIKEAHWGMTGGQKSS